MLNENLAAIFAPVQNNAVKIRPCLNFALRDTERRLGWAGGGGRWRAV